MCIVIGQKYVSYLSGICVLDCKNFSLFGIKVDIFFFRYFKLYVFMIDCMVIRRFNVFEVGIRSLDFRIQFFRVQGSVKYFVFFVSELWIFLLLFKEYVDCVIFKICLDKIKVK